MTTTIDLEELEELEEELEDKPFDPAGKYTGLELEEEADKLLKADADRELCRKCKEKDPDAIPYGEETGEVESVPQFDDEHNPLVDEEGNQLYLDFPELRCSKGHRWYKGEGARRNINGPNPILFESHLASRKRREIMVKSGIPDPAFTKDRWGRPIQGIYNRVHPDGRRVNTEDQRKSSGASFYRAFFPLPFVFAYHGSITYGILSIGLIWLVEIVSKKQPMQSICEIILRKTQRLVKRREPEIEDMPPSIV